MRTIQRIVILFMLISPLLLAAGDSAYNELSRDSKQQMEKQRVLISDLCEKYKLGSLNKTPADYDLIQMLLDMNLVHNSMQPYVRSLGIVFGDALIAEVPGLTWVESSDTVGSNPKLRYAKMNDPIDVLSLIAKMVESKYDSPSVRKLADNLKKTLLESK